MPILEFQPTSSWKHDFRRLEMRFFDIAAGDWEVAANRTPNQLHGNYNSTVHRLHVDFLNQGLPLGEKIESGDFDGDLALIRLRDDVVGPRIAEEPTRRIELVMPAATLGLDHLL